MSSKSGWRMGVVAKRLAPTLVCIQTAYVGAYILRQTIVLVISFVYVRKVHFYSSSPGATQEQEQLYRWLVLLGANYRPLEAASVPSYLIYALVPSLFYILPKLVQLRHANWLDNSSLYTLLVRPQKSRERVEAKLEDCIGRVLESNTNHLRSGRLMFSAKAVANAGLPIELEEETTWLSKQPDSLHLRRGSLATFRRLRPPKEPFKAGSRDPGRLASNKMDQAHNQLAKDIFKATCRQHSHIQQLFQDKSSLWPVNRCEQWRARLAAHWRLVYVSFALFIYWGSQGATQMAQWLCLQERLGGFNDQASLVGPEPRDQVFFVDRLAMFEQSLFVWFGCHYFIVPVSVLMAILHDQMHFLASLNARFKLFFHRVGQIRHRPGPVDEARNQFECDGEALEIYLQFQYFNRELKDNLGLVAFVLSQYAAFMVVLVFGSVSVASLIHHRHLYLLGLLVMLSLVTTNCIFYLAAAFNAHCINCFKLAWTLIATCRPRQRALHSGSSARATGSLTSGPHWCPDADSASANVSMEHLVTPHTLLLWNRLVFDHKQITDQLACRVFGLIRMDYSNLIRFNFWLASVVMLMLTQNPAHHHQKAPR